MLFRISHAIVYGRLKTIAFVGLLHCAAAAGNEVGYFDAMFWFQQVGNELKLEAPFVRHNIVQVLADEEGGRL